MDQREFVHMNNTDLINYEDTYVRLSARTQAMKGTGFALDPQELEILVKLLELHIPAEGGHVQAIKASGRLAKLHAFLEGALKWSKSHPGDVVS